MPSRPMAQAWRKTRSPGWVNAGWRALVSVPQTVHLDFSFKLKKDKTEGKTLAAVATTRTPAPCD